MRSFAILAAATMFVAVPAFAQDAATADVAATATAQAAPAAATASAAVEIKSGMTLMSADGRKLGRIQRVNRNATGLTNVSLIKGAKFVYVPAATISAGENGRLVTSLNYGEVK